MKFEKNETHIKKKTYHSGNHHLNLSAVPSNLLSKPQCVYVFYRYIHEITDITQLACLQCCFPPSFLRIVP